MSRAIIIIIFILAGGISSGAEENAKPVLVQESAKEPFAVVELFTSEGCSSCPPADEFLTELVQTTEKTGRIFSLSFHVDYWNRLGWHDPFSNSAFTHRQRTYAYALGTSDVYTPQMIVNGTYGFNGANRVKALKYIKLVLKQPAEVSVALSLGKDREPDSIVVEYLVSETAREHILYLALVEKGIINRVLSGENAGMLLHHANVVRAFKSVRLKKSLAGRIEFSLPDSVDREDFAVIGYIQNTKTMVILGADSLDL